MKTIPPPCPEPETGPKYWRSLDQLADTPEFHRWVEREFPAGADELTDPVTRRHFVKLMSASFLLAGLGLTGCRRPTEKILPYSKMPEGYVHGVPQHYATAMPVRGSVIPLVARSNEGRPTKVEGNALHPDSNGGTDPFAQASVLNLYDVDRAMRFAKRGNTVKREAAFDFLAELSKKAQVDGGQGLSFLVERSSSPSRARLQKLIGDKFPKARWHVFEPVDFDIHRQAASTAFGKPVAPYWKLDEAKVIVSLDCDFIGAEQDAHLHIRRFAKGRRVEKPGDSLSRLYTVEALFTLTGANADHRLRIPAGMVQAVAAGLAAEVLKKAGRTELAAALQAQAQPAAAHARWIAECAADLWEPQGKPVDRGKTLVLAGHRQPAAVHVMAHAINMALGSIGKTIELHEAPEPKEGTLVELARELNDGQVDTLVVLGGNPVYNAPGDLNWARTQRKARTIVRLGYFEDETFAVSDWHLPLAHYLESWGDARTADGTLVPVQPLIEPLFGGVTELEVLAHIAGHDKTGAYDIVRETYRGLGGESDDSWKKFLHDGFLAGSAGKPVAAEFNWSAAGNVLGAAKPVAVPSKDSLEVIFHRDYSLDDGRYNNNGWLQELPDPITKMVWENVVLLSATTARELGLEIKDKENLRLRVPVVKIRLGGREIEGPAWIQPGMADHVLGLALGYGRQKTGRIGRGSGFDAYRLRGSDAPHFAAGAKVSPAGRLHPLATTQNHWSMEGRPVIREANVEQFKKHPQFAKGMNMHEPPVPKDEPGASLTLYPNPLDIQGKDGRTPRERATHAWGMSIDLNTCVGCSACMMACQSENNLPIVGKDQVSRNREMHWIRLDRYYTGSVEDPQAVTQPMLCQHCESAPCESVCPVNATVHDDEGLNVMAYNRCVGTRYCSNNCPYKVRRFNYLDYHRRPLELLTGPVYTTPLTHATDGEWDLIRWFKDPDRGIRPDDEWELLKLVKNPDVTVRMRGVMEKCTFCLQRIEQAKIAQKVKAGASGDVEVPDGTIKTACQQACPAEAIVFGNLKDPKSRVSQLKKQERDYTVLEFLATKPRTTYLARIRNPNAKMPDYHEEPFSVKEWEQKGNSLLEEGGHGRAHGAEARPGRKGAH